MFALVDCNSFYVSCERLFNPRLRDKAVVVLSNNDGCVVARSREAKIIPVPMGVPFFQIKPAVDAGKVIAFSSNYTLYGDISQRVMTTLSEFGSAQEIYSIDECFLTITGDNDPCATMMKARAKVLRHIGIPTSIGIGPTKTLAKLASELAKNNPLGVFYCPAPGPELAEVLRAIPLSDVWGIGPRMSIGLHNLGLKTALDVARLPIAVMRETFGIVGARIVEELRGVSCLKLEEHAPAKQSITVSRSFGQQISALSDLRAAVATFTEQAGEKLRAQQLCASSLTVFIERNRFLSHAPLCDGAMTINFLTATQLTSELIVAADALVQRLWRSDGQWKKAGIVLQGLIDQHTVQQNFLDPIDRPRHAALMTTLDTINHKHGRAIIHSGAAHLSRDWRPINNQCSPRYSTCWDEVLSV
jgi:DNA polymerase V